MKKIFLKKSRSSPTLYWDMILVEMKDPILFTCNDDDGNYYICSCPKSDSEVCEWVIVPTTSSDIIELLTNKITIRQIFDKCETPCFFATQCANETNSNVSKIGIQDLPDEVLPTPGFYMDAEPSEFSEEIDVLMMRKFEKMQKEIIFCKRFAERISVHQLESAMISIDAPSITEHKSGMKKMSFSCASALAAWG